MHIAAVLKVILLIGLFIQGIYRKPPSAKNKKLLKEALEQGSIMLWYDHMLHM